MIPAFDEIVRPISVAGEVDCRLASRFVLVRTMVFTPLPSNVLLLLVSTGHDAGWAIAILLVRFSISQIDVPTWQPTSMAVVCPEERSASAGITGVARTTGAAWAPGLADCWFHTRRLLKFRCTWRVD